MSRLTYFAVGLVVFTGFLLVMAPASSLYRLIENNVQRTLPDTTITGISGSLWQGSADVYFRQLPPVELNWRLSPLALITGAAHLNIQLDSAGLEAEFKSIVASDSGQIESGSGILDSTMLNPMTIPYGLDLSGDIQLHHVTLAFDQNWLLNADAALAWSGGIVHIETPEQIHTTKLPALQGTVSMVGPDLLLNVSSADESLMAIKVRRDGWAEVTITYAMADLANLPLPGSNNTLDRSQTAITLEEKIL